MFKKFADFFVERQLIAESDKLLFTYASKELAHTMLIIVSIISLGYWHNHIHEAVVFLLIFPTIRKYTGGIHAYNRLTCYIVTIYMFLFSLWALGCSNALMLFILSTIATKYICCHAPAEQRDGILNLRQKTIYQGIGRKITFCFWELGIFLMVYTNDRIGKSIFMILILSGVNLYLQKCKTVSRVPLKMEKFLKVFAVAVMSFGIVSIRGACAYWNYQSELTADIQKYADN